MAKKSSPYYGPKRKKGLFGQEGYTSAKAAYRAYENARLRQVENPALAPEDKFNQIWGWGSAGGQARAALKK